MRCFSSRCFQRCFKQANRAKFARMNVLATVATTNAVCDQCVFETRKCRAVERRNIAIGPVLHNVLGNEQVGTDVELQVRMQATGEKETHVAASKALAICTLDTRSKPV